MKGIQGHTKPKTENTANENATEAGTKFQGQEIRDGKVRGGSLGCTYVHRRRFVEEENGDGNLAR